MSLKMAIRIYCRVALRHLFVGQNYTASRRACVLAYINAENVPFPALVNLYHGFLRHSKQEFSTVIDFDWAVSMFGYLIFASYVVRVTAFHGPEH